MALNTAAFLAPDPIGQSLVGSLLGGKKAAPQPTLDGYDPAVIQALSSQGDILQGYNSAVAANPKNSQGGFQGWLARWLAADPSRYAAASKSYQATAPVPVEQQLLDQSLPGLEGQVAQDETVYGPLSQSLLKQNQEGYDTLRSTFQQAIPGADGVSPLLAQQNAAALTAEQANKGSLGTEIDALRAAQAPLSAENLRAAETQATAANLAGQQQKQSIEAGYAGQGFVGGSTMEDNALAQALIGAQQNAAGAVGNARVQNATADTNIGNYGAHTNYGLENTFANQQQQNLMNQYGTQTAAAAALAGLPTAQAQSTPAIANLANTGLLNAQNALNWWSTGGTPQTPGYVPVTASNMGNDISGLGAGAVSGAINVANANNWWKTPTATPSAAPQTGASFLAGQANTTSTPTAPGAFG